MRCTDDCTTRGKPGLLTPVNTRLAVEANNFSENALEVGHMRSQASGPDIPLHDARCGNLNVLHQRFMVAYVSASRIPPAPSDCGIRHSVRTPRSSSRTGRRCGRNTCVRSRGGSTTACAASCHCSTPKCVVCPARAFVRRHLPGRRREIGFRGTRRAPSSCRANLNRALAAMAPAWLLTMPALPSNIRAKLCQFDREGSTELA